MDNKSKNFAALKFAGVNIPQPTESFEKTNSKPVYWGSDDLYPHFLLKLYQESPIHSAIINAKANYIIGDGLKYASGEAVKMKLNAGDAINEFLNKITLDYLIFNGFAVEVIYNKLNQPIEYHFVPFHKVRTNKDKTKFWFYDNIQWAKNTYVTYERWKPLADNPNSKLFYFDGYFPSVNSVYPTPEYNGAVTSIKTDMAIRDFNLNNITNHFSVSTIITFFKGQSMPEELKNEILKGLESAYTGANGKKLIVDFQDAGALPADVKNISPNDWDKAYDLVSKKVSEDIMQGHSVVSPSLFGVKTEGQLGGSQELEQAYEIFKANYVRNKRNEIQSALNMLFKGFEGISGQVEFADRQLFNARMSESTKEKIYTINELRKEANLPALPNGDRLLADKVETPAMPVQQSMKAQEYHLTEEDFEKIKHLGSTSEEFEFIEEGEFITSKEAFKKVQLAFDDLKDIGDYLTENDMKGKSLDEIRKAIKKDLGIKVTAEDLKNTLNKLNKVGVLDITVDGDTVSVKPLATPKTVMVMYSYEVKAGLGKPIIPGTRPFCKKLVESNRVFSTEDIQTMSGIFGYDVMEFAGGYYNDGAGNISKSCRHYFKSNIVSRRNKS